MGTRIGLPAFRSSVKACWSNGLTVAATAGANCAVAAVAATIRNLRRDIVVDDLCERELPSGRIGDHVQITASPRRSRLGHYALSNGPSGLINSAVMRNSAKLRALEARPAMDWTSCIAPLRTRSGGALAMLLACGLCAAPSERLRADEIAPGAGVARP